MKTRIETRWIVLAVALVALTWVATATIAQPPAKRGQGGPRMGGPEAGPPAGMPMARIKHLAAALDLTEEQQNQIEAIIDEGAPKRAELRKQLMRLRNELQGVFLEDEPNVDAAKQITVQIGEVRTNMQLQRLEERLAVRAVLTPEQRDELMLMRGHGRRWGGRDNAGRCNAGQGNGGRGNGGHGNGARGHGGDCPWSDRMPGRSGR